jgi:hydrogenase/urease accessory protein HupE
MSRFAALFLFFVFFVSGEAVGHPLLQNSMWVLIEPGRVQVAVNVSARELSLVQGIATEDPPADTAAIEAAAARHGDYVLKHMRLQAAGRPLSGTVARISPPPEFRAIEQTFFQYELIYTFDQPAPAAIAFSQDTLTEFSYAPGEAWDVTYAIKCKRSDSPDVEVALLRAGQSVKFSTGSDNPERAGVPGINTRGLFRQYLFEGVMHILTGYDHLLFVSALVLATVTFWEMVKVIAAFTLAHTLTLALSAMNIFRLPPWFVEPVIAASIVFVALENILWPASTQSRLRLVVAFGFGLIHGLGFAGGLLEAMEGLPKTSIGLVIVAFSLGVEIGHQLVVLPLFGVLRLGKGKWENRFHPAVMRYGSILISLFGAYYLVHALNLA